jgi:metal-sulfur cluster biosynthetic enzyme
MAANPNPTVYATAEYVRHIPDNIDSSDREPIDSLEIYEHIRFILDPEHPLTLEQLHIVAPSGIDVDDACGSVEVVFTPTVPNCSLPAVLGLCIREKLLRVLPLRFHSKIRIKVAQGTHVEEDAVNRQLRDKERCLAAVERRNIRDMIEQCISNQG